MSEKPPITQRWTWLKLGIAVQKRTTELNGSYAANAITLIAFVSLFPLILLVISVTGLLTGSDPHITDNLISNLGLTGHAADLLRSTLNTAENSGTTGSIIALVGMAWSGLALVGALRFVVNLPYGHSVKGWRARLLGVPWLFGAILIFVASFGVSAVVNWLPGWAAPLALLVSIALDIALFGWTFWFLDVRRPSPRLLLPGVLFAAVGFELLKALGTYVVPRLIASSSATYGSLGATFAILAWLLIFGRLVVYAVIFNAVWADHVAGRPLTAKEAEDQGDAEAVDAAAVDESADCGSGADDAPQNPQ